MNEVRRYYRCHAWNDKGEAVTSSFRADNIMLAYDHAEALCRRNELQMDIVVYVGREEPTTDFGAFPA